MRRIVGWSNDRQELLEMEHHWLRLIPDDQLSKRCYNLHNGKPGHWSAHHGKRMTVGQKISISNSKPFSAECREAHLRGKTLSDEHRKKIAAGNRGKKVLAERRAQIGAGNRGRKHTAESRANMAAAQRGKKHTAETRAKIGAANRSRTGNRGWKHTAEARASIAASLRGRIKAPEARAALKVAMNVKRECPHCYRQVGPANYVRHCLRCRQRRQVG